MIVLLAALLSGAMFYLSQGLDDLWLLAWLAPAPLLWLAYGKTQDWRLFLVSAAATLGGLIYVFQCYGALPPLLLLEIMVPQVVLFPTAIAFARNVQHHSGPFATLLAFPACWTAIEFLISLVSRHAAGANQAIRASWVTRSRIARARCDIACFSSGASSASVRWSDSTSNTGS